MKNHTQEFLKERKFIMALPILIIPFLTMFFWALGGGKGTPLNAQPTEQAGLNLSLPDAHFDKKESWNKFAIYEMAARDSLKYEQARERDPYFDLIAFQTEKDLTPQIDTTKKGSQLIDSFKQKEKPSSDVNEERVNKKLQELYSEINKVPNSSSQLPTAVIQTDPQFTTDVDRLEAMMEMMNDNTAPDPEMQQIASVLDKILDIQHPERVKEKLGTGSQNNIPRAFPVEVLNKEDNIALINTGDSTNPFPYGSNTSYNQDYFLEPIRNGFFGLEDDNEDQPLFGNTIQAIIHDTQELVTGATVRMRLLNDIEIQGKPIPKDQFITGFCNITGERLMIEINSIRTGNHLLPVSLEVYDMDGLEGIYIPGAITRDAAKQGTDNALQSIQLMSMDTSIGAQAAAAGMEAAKGLLSKKTKLIKVTVKAGYQILLRNSNTANY